MTEEVQQQTIFSFNFDDKSKEHIKSIGQWAVYNAILSFIALGISIFQFMMASSEVYNSPAFTMGIKANNGLTLFFQVVFSVLLNVYLYNTSVKLKKGIDAMDSRTLTKGFGLLRTYYKIYGILLIIVLIICSLGLVYLYSMRGAGF
ncbi:hypothetical protein [Ferruginibacter sp. SUN106]|uniref:hypothetical protein n=1 Tax=Ferruginibacter sp. SUN106 TaxID=2978348 RepID=UPI003D35DF9A